METVGKDFPIAELEKEVKNRWRWQWLEESVDGVSISDWCRKVNEPGICLCLPCGRTIKYGSSGKKALKDHAQDEAHKKAQESLTGQYKLPFAEESVSRTAVSVTERVQEVKGRIGLFVAEHCLPYSISGPLLSLVKELAKDIPALEATSMERKACTYTITHGIAKAVKEKLKSKLQGCFFSLNVDEATNHAHDKVLNILCQYYDEAQGQFCIELLGSRVVNLATSENLYQAITSVLMEYSLRWEQVVSIMMDNCRVMRGCKNGVEAKAKEANEHLMDISGDTVHMINNAAEAFFDQIEKQYGVRKPLGSVYYDIQDSPKMKELFHQVQALILKKSHNFLSVLRPMPTRFLQMHDVAQRTLDLWDVLWIFYYGTLSAEEKKTHQSHLQSLFKKYDVPKESQVSLIGLWKDIRRNKSPSGVDRTDAIALFFFHNMEKSQFHLKLCTGILSQFKGYVLKFQSKKPLVHQLHADMFCILQEFYSGFILPERIPLVEASKLCALDVEDATNHLPKHRMSVGTAAFNDLSILKKDKRKNAWLDSFFQALHDAYVAGAKKLASLPLENETLNRLAAFDPGLQRSATTASSVLALARKLPNVVNPEELGALDCELRKYTTDKTMSLLEYDPTNKETRIDKDWYCHLFSLTNDGQSRYPVLGKLVKAVLSAFSGPIVEGTFNLMDDIIEKDRTRLTPENFEALLLVKQHLISTSTSAVNYPICLGMKKKISAARSSYFASLSSAEVPPSTVTSKSSIPPALPSKSSSKCAAASHSLSVSTPNPTSASSTSAPSLASQSSQQTPASQAATLTGSTSESTATTSLSSTANPLKSTQRSALPVKRKATSVQSITKFFKAV